MKRVLMLAVVLGALIIVEPSASFAQTGKSFQAASKALVEQGYVALKAEKNWDALELFEKAVVAHPHNISAYVGLGKAHQALGSISGGLKYFAIALELDPRDLAAWEAKVSAHLVISELTEAKEALSRMQAVCSQKPCLEADRAKAAVDAYQAKVVASVKKP